MFSMVQNKCKGSMVNEGCWIFSIAAIGSKVFQKKISGGEGVWLYSGHKSTINLERRAKNKNKMAMK